MGLNIYVRWGVQIDEDGNCMDFPDEMRQKQFTGYRDAPEVGYMRYNWTSARIVRELSAAIDAPSPIRGLYPEWNDHNGEELLVTGAELERLTVLRLAIHQWLRTANINAYMSVFSAYQQEDPKELWSWFCDKLNGTATLISFVEQHKDKPGLRIQFD